LRPLALAVSLALAAGLLACGGGDDEASTATSTTEATDSTPTQNLEARKKAAVLEKLRRLKEERQQSGGSTQPQTEKSGAKRPPSSFTPPEHTDSGGGAAQFHHKGSDNSIQEFGSEASAEERQQAADSMHAYLDARAARQWGAACSHMSSASIGSLERLVSGASQSEQAPKGCAPVLAAISARVSDEALEQIAEADVGSLRVDGQRGFLLYHGRGGDDYAMPMALESGEWKVGALEGSPLL
jgi:hypothetical protein